MPLQRLTDFLKKVSILAFETIAVFYIRHGLMRSASLAYTTLLAIVPLSIIIISIVSFIHIFDPLIAKIEGFIFANFVPHAGNEILQTFLNFQQQAHHLPWMSFLFLFITSMMMLTTMESHLNELWDIIKQRFLGLSLLIHWLILTIGPLLLCTSLVISSYLFSSHWFDAPAFTELELSLPFICSFLAYTFLYIAIPNCKVKVTHAMTGAFIAAIGFEGAKIGFAAYTRFAPAYSIVYGALAVIPLFLIWLYLCSMIFLLGGQIVNTLRVTAEGHPPLQEEYK